MKKHFLPAIIFIAIAMAGFTACKKNNSQNVKPKVDDTMVVKMVKPTIVLHQDNQMRFYNANNGHPFTWKFAMDDYVTLLLTGIDSLNADTWPAAVGDDAFITSNAMLFHKGSNMVYVNSLNSPQPGEPPFFNTYFPFSKFFSLMPQNYQTIDRFDGATYSTEQAYDNNAPVATFIFYNFKENKYVYYGMRKNGPLVISNYTLPELCPNCDKIDWTKIDAVSGRNIQDLAYNNELYFIDYDAKLVYYMTRVNRDSNNPHMSTISEGIPFEDFFKDWNAGAPFE